MSITIIDHSSTLSAQTRARFRRSSPGPETDLVEWFLVNWKVRVPKGCQLTIFREPHLESGYPDLVLVNWHVETASQWDPSRAQVTPRDLRLMQFLALQGPTPEERLVASFGRSTTAILNRLEAASMVKMVRKVWRASPLARTFAVREIIAVEAKMTRCRVALQQASLNTWFASSSYILLPNIPAGSRYLETAKQEGVGIWAKSGHGEDQRTTGRQDLPRSYASWLFNEWAWRASLGHQTSEPSGPAA